MARMRINCDVDIFATGSTGHLGSTEDRAPSSIVMIRTGAFININSDLYHDHRGVIHGARGLNVNIALGRPCYNELVFAVATSSSVGLTIASVK